MRNLLKKFGGIINTCQILVGLSILLLGTLVYLIDRPPHNTYFVFKSFKNISLYDTLPNIFGSIGNNLPSFIHVFSFILITGGFLSCQKRGCLIVCAFWFLAEIFFELGQKFNSLILKTIPNWFLGVPLLENTKNYFVRGTFDYFDILAIAIGTITAYLVLLITYKKK